jgi:hypothetical protein
VRAIDRMWMHIRNAQAPRNRLKIAMREMKTTIRTVSESRKGGPVNILSLGAGSAQGVIQVVAEMKRQNIWVSAFLIDTDRDAIEHAFKLAYVHGVRDRVGGIAGDAIFFERLARGFRADIVEMMGLLDYFEDKLAVRLFLRIRNYLRRGGGGHFFVSQVHPNLESFFLKHVVDWGKMYYRDRDHLARLFRHAGMGEPRIETERHGIQSIAVARVA